MTMKVSFLDSPIKGSPQKERHLHYDDLTRLVQKYLEKSPEDRRFIEPLAIDRKERYVKVLSSREKKDETIEKIQDVLSRPNHQIEAERKLIYSMFAAELGLRKAEEFLENLHEDPSFEDILIKSHIFLAKKGNRKSIEFLIEFYEDRGESTKVFEYDLMNAEQGDPFSMYKVGSAYLEKYPVKAFYWLEKAHSKKDELAYIPLAQCLLKGKGTEADEERGFELIKTQVEEDIQSNLGNVNSEALEILIDCYEKGIGTKKNPAEVDRLKKVEADLLRRC